MDAKSEAGVTFVTPAPFLLAGCDRYTDLGSNQIAGDYQFHAAILLTTRGRIIRRHRPGFSEAVGSNGPTGHSLSNQVIAYGATTLLGKRLIVVIRTDTVGMAFYREAQPGMPRDNAGYFGQLLSSFRT
jgi:hypothetical protein